MRGCERGVGPPVVLVHGIPTSPALSRHVIPLVDGARLLAWEMLGTGCPPAPPQGVKAQAEYLRRRFVREIRVDGAVLVRHDLGGGVAQIAGVHEPDVRPPDPLPAHRRHARGRATPT